MTGAQSQAECVVVLGMHRSGTSALAGILGLLGVHLGSKLLNAPAEENAKGFCEHTGILDLQQTILLTLGSNWDDTRPLPAYWWGTRYLRNWSVRRVTSSCCGTPAK